MNVALVALLFSMVGTAADISGVVLDPQGQPIAKARVLLTCGSITTSVVTDERGRFTFENAVAEACTLAVEQQESKPAQVRLDDVRQLVNVTATAPRSSFLSLSLSDDEFKRMAGNTSDLIRHAQLLAGATTVPGVVYVDGLPSSTLPPLDMIARVTVNADPFSAEYADGDVATIQLFTKAPARTFRFHSGSDAIGFGGRDPLSSDAASESVAGSFGLSGPIPRVPLTFSVSANGGRTSTAAPVLAIVPDSIQSPDQQDIATVNRYRAAAVELYYSPSVNNRVRLNYRDNSSSGENIGVGGLILPEAGMSTTGQTRELRVTMTRSTGGLTHETGALATITGSTTTANSDALGVSVAGSFVAGGASVSRATTRRLHWTAKHVVRSDSARPWSAGVIVSGSEHLTDETPNPAGLIQFDSLDAYDAGLFGASTGVLFRARGNGRVAYSTISAAPFAQKVLLRTTGIEMNAGVRLDYQRRFGAVVSPRFSVAINRAGFTIGMGSGVFARPIPDFAVIRTIARDGRHLQQFLATDVSLADVDQPSLIQQALVRSQLDGELKRPREFMQRVSIERVFGRFVPAFEYTWSREQHRLGSERRRHGNEWLDTVVSNRASDRHRLHAQVRYLHGRHNFTGHYEWMRARDNSDGPLSFPIDPNDLRQEWAPSAGRAPHNVTVVGSIALPAGISLNVSDTWHGASPYNITTGLDARGDGLYNDRGGRPRNSGRAPGFNALSLYGYRRLLLPDALVPGSHRLHLNVGVQASNILDNRNYTSIGSVIGASSFGRPLAAYPGRSLRVFLNVD